MAVRWSEVADATRRHAHALMQWHALVGSPDPFNFAGSQWCGHPPDRGDLAPAHFGALCDLLATHTRSASRCFFAVWEGWAWVHGGGIRFTLVSEAARREGIEPTCEPTQAAFSGQERHQARLVLPGREYVLLTGPLSAANQLGDPDGLDGFEQHSPNLMWPADRAWFVASEIDFDSTLIGGTAELVAAILSSPALEAWPVEPDSSLASDADEVNPV